MNDKFYVETNIDAPRLPRAFFLTDGLTLAKELLGKIMVHETEDGTIRAVITETEAYMGATDKGSHAYGKRRTDRTETMFHQGGTSYVYLIYGMYNCLNFVTEAEGEPAAVLIRGLEVISGKQTIKQLRYPKSSGEMTPYQRKNFLNGPGKLCKGLSLDRSVNGTDLTGEVLYVIRSDEVPKQIYSGPRIGIDYAEEAVHFPWRFWI